MHPKALLETGADLTAQVLKFDHPADATLARFFREHRQLGSRERHTLSDVVFTVLREKPRLEWLVARHPAVAGEGKGERKAALPRRLALLALALQPGGAEFAAGAAAEAEQAWLLESAAWARTLPADAPPECRHLLPAWLAERLRAEVGEEFDPLAAALCEPAPLDLRVNGLKAKRALVLKALAEAGLEAGPTPYSPLGVRLQGKPSLTRLPLYTGGEVEVQDEGSQLLALLLEPRRHEVVVDFCAGAGGKTLALGAAMRNTGRLYAFDTSAHRLEALQPRLQRSGLGCVHPMVIAHEGDARIRRLDGKVDRVLVDAPCSGLGTLRRSPDLKWRQTEAGVAELAALQARILESAARLLKPGGRLVYATCSLLPQENEDVAAAFSTAHRDFLPLDAGELLLQAGAGHASELVRGGYLRLWPHRHGTDGFFAAAWQRRP
jgi:16S rRNA (cytosine967-C5)-methyltransferase